MTKPKDTSELLVPYLRSRPPEGTKYRPSNGTEGDGFRASYCDQCERDRTWREQGRESCAILCLTLLYHADEPEYPAEWQWNADGVPCCTAFVPEGEQLPTDTDMEALGQLNALGDGTA